MNIRCNEKESFINECPIMEHETEIIKNKYINHNVEHIVPINTKYVNHHIYNHYYTLVYNYSECDVIENMIPRC